MKEEIKNCCDKCCHRAVCKNKVKAKGVQEGIESIVLGVDSFDGLRVTVTCDHFLELKENRDGEYWK